MKKIALITLALTLILSCNTINNDNSLKSDLILNEIYSQDEINELEKIISFVDSEIIKITNENDINNAYHDLFEKLAVQTKKNGLNSSIIKEEVKYSFLETLDTNVFNSIFRFNQTFKQINYRDSVLTDFSGIKILNIQPFNRYVKYLTRLGETNKSYKEIADMAEMAGDFSASFVHGYPSNQSKFDFKNETDRLFAAIFILRLEDNINIKLDRYFKNKNATQQHL